MTSYKRAGAVILNNDLNKCLMVFQKSSSYWGIPKGSKLYMNEDNFVCMVREVKEEVGLDLNHIRFEILGNLLLILKHVFIFLKSFWTHCLFVHHHLRMEMKTTKLKKLNG